MSKPRPSKEFQNFDAGLRKLLAVPHADVQKRIEQHREQAAQNPRKRGPKPKSSASASDRDDA